MKINVNVIWDCRVLMACNGRADRICTSIVIYNELSKPCKCSSSNVAIHNEIYFIMWKPFGNEPVGCWSVLNDAFCSLTPSCAVLGRGCSCRSCL